MSLKLKEILFGYLTESVQSLVNIGFPKIIASIFNAKFGKNAHIIGKWYKEYDLLGSDRGNKWWKRPVFSMMQSDKEIRQNVEMYEMLQKVNTKEEFEKERDLIQKKYMYESLDFSEQKIDLIQYLKTEIEKQLLNSFFFDKRIIKNIMDGTLTDLKPYEKLDFFEANKKYEEKVIFSDLTPVKSYPNGWRWINVGKRCEYVGNMMRNCGSSGVMSYDKDRTIIALFDKENKPHVVVTYSPNEKRISGDEGGAGTPVKNEYADYVLDLSNVLGANFDSEKTKSKFLRVKHKIGDKLKSIKQVPGKNPFTEVYKIKLTNGKVYFTNGYEVISEEELKTVIENLTPEEKRSVKPKTIFNYVLFAFYPYYRRSIPIDKFVEAL